MAAWAGKMRMGEAGGRMSQLRQEKQAQSKHDRRERNGCTERKEHCAACWPTPSFLQMRKPHPRRGSGWTIASTRGQSRAQDSLHTALGTLHGRRSKQAGKEKDKRSEGVRKKEKRERERGREGAKAVKRE